MTLGWRCRPLSRYVEFIFVPPRGKLSEFKAWRPAQKIADKRGDKYCHVINHVRTRLRFALLKGVLIALTGERGRPTKNQATASVILNLV